ncbi:hypothetical protein EXN66_Car014966 [Channa argus]|uniref:Uncharacterized protein n=1 Tax=Channa argus TaxID=215402 RepID=A0A6G1QA40_CHAAH|nr:hypothetical protein EXN66_Car014966 [Channa argus]
MIVFTFQGEDRYLCLSFMRDCLVSCLSVCVCVRVCVSVCLCVFVCTCAMIEDLPADLTMQYVIFPLYKSLLPHGKTQSITLSSFRQSGTSHAAAAIFHCAV